MLDHYDGAHVPGLVASIVHPVDVLMQPLKLNWKKSDPLATGGYHVCVQAQYTSNRWQFAIVLHRIRARTVQASAKCCRKGPALLLCQTNS